MTPGNGSKKPTAVSDLLAKGQGAFERLRDPREFAKVTNGGYFVEWECGADLSADTIEARWVAVDLASNFRG